MTFRATPVRVETAEVQVVVPARSDRVAGVSMAGFRGWADSVIDLQLVPYPAVTVLIDFGDPLVIDDARGGRKRGSVVVGLAPGSVRIGGYGRAVDCLQLRLSPMAAQAMFGDCSELGETVVALEDLWGRDAARTLDQLHAAKSWEDRFAIAAAIALRNDERGGVDPEIAYIWRRMRASRGQVRVEQLAAEVGWSRKRLWSRFRVQIGLTPKRAAKLVRFDHAAHRLAAGHSAAVVAAECGFVDQSHLCLDVMDFVGMTPTAVAGAPWLAVDDLAWPVP
jgi:AraC-like DNA-binding protein